MSWLLLATGLLLVTLTLSRLLRAKSRIGQYRSYKSQIGGWNRLIDDGPPSTALVKFTVFVTNIGMTLAGLVLVLMGLVRMG